MNSSKKQTTKWLAWTAFLLALLGGLITFLVFRYREFWKYP
jgi:hypothetical protein